LYIGEKVGIVNAKDVAGPRPVRYAEVDIAVDPLEGTNLCATGAPNAIAVLAASERGGLLHAPDLYMEKLVVGPSSKEDVSLAATGVTDGTLMRGVRFFGDGTRTSSVLMQNQPHQIRFVDSIHVADAGDVKIRF